MLMPPPSSNHEFTSTHGGSSLRFNVKAHMKEPIDVTVPQSETPAPGLNLGDFYYIFFRHKGKILLIFLAGLIGAASYYFVRPPVYQSEAKILIRYIVEGKTGTSAKDELQMKSPDSQGANIINSEIEILTSLDLAEHVADSVGPEKILAKLGGGNDRVRAATVIHGGLKVEVPGRSSVILITFRHPDAAVVQPVLSQLTDTYLKRHVEIHRGVGVRDDFFSRQADQLRSRLATTEADLKKLKAEVNVISLDESKRAYMELMVKIRQELMAAEANLAEQRALLTAPTKPNPDATPATNNAVMVSAETVEQYKRACSDLEFLPKRLAELRAQYTEEHFQVRQVRQQVAQAESRKKELEAMFPQLLQQVPHILADTSTSAMPVAALEAKIKVLAGQLEQVRADANKVMDAEPTLLQLQRQKEFEENSYRFYSSNLEDSRVAESLGTGEITNISVVQKPTPPARDLKRVLKPMLILMVMGCFGGFGLGFVSERILDRTIKGVSDVERQGRLPLFITVPDTVWKPGFTWRMSRHSQHRPAKPGPGNGEYSNGDPHATPTTAMAPWDPQHGLKPYFEALRDRLITYSEVHGIEHKPKLVAVTSCHNGAGVTTTAAGLAAALSETGDGSVLLVDMNREQGAAHDFYKGQLACGLSEALENGGRDPACVQENLYLVSAHEPNDQKLPRVLPKRFAHLVPRMKASDYDYIVFDMPPVTQTSVTARLSGFMDMVLLVIESEKTGSEIVQRANGLLAESRANVAAVLNKHRAYLPRKLSQEL